MKSQNLKDNQKNDHDKTNQWLQNDSISNNSIKSQISALMDNEVDLDDVPHLMTAIKAGNNAAECWESYHLIGDVMRGNTGLNTNFKSNFMQKLNAEPTVFIPNIIPIKTRKMPSAWSVAASVAAVAFVSWFAMQEQGVTSSQAPQQLAESVSQDYLVAHQSMAPSNSAYFVQDAAFIKSK